MRRKPSATALRNRTCGAEQYELAWEESQKWRRENPANQVRYLFRYRIGRLTGEWNEAKRLLDEAAGLVQEEPMITALQGSVACIHG